MCIHVHVHIHTCEELVNLFVPIAFVFLPIDFENLYQQSISCITAETTDQCSLPGLELQVFDVFVILVGKKIAYSFPITACFKPRIYN